MSGDPLQDEPEKIFPLVDPQEARVRAAALADLRENGLDDEALRDIEAYWRRQDEKRARMLRAAEIEPAPTPLQRVHGAEQDPRDRGHAQRLMDEARRTCQQLLERAGAHSHGWFWHRFTLVGTADDGMGREVRVRIQAESLKRSLAASEPITVEIEGVPERLLLYSNIAVLHTDPYAPQRWREDATSSGKAGPPGLSLAEAEFWKGIIDQLALRYG